ncbi:carboxymuconolactone decarboxylase family protein [Streptomyces sp. N2-109]|uniref:Carboxymuconolactone decarboxylase family protein n=1 Tax=Streptomyces gossypii TaxID=2883101 RepID=A0ABT2JZJ6_9ACTN|nr:carboxymuconolactone decarboxylase family protein [Streptomyces gossypii]MCT2593339.1 carboxymuconolactone decarboxylase family protein [Streptomyces gossypii]
MTPPGRDRPAASAPRITPGSRKEVGALVWLFSHLAGFVSRTRAPALFLTLGRHRKLFRGWLRFAGRLMPGGTLPRRETELVILRVAHLRGCSYEFEHHKRLGRRAGVTRADLDRIVDGSDDAAWTTRERALLAATDMLHERQDLDDTAWQDLRAHLDENAAIELLLLVGHYQMLATTITALRLSPDAPRGEPRG